MKAKGAILSAQGASFDVICVGEALWTLASASFWGPRPGAPDPLRPAGGAVSAAAALARAGLRVGLCTALADDEAGRSLLERMRTTGVDLGGVALAPPRAGLFLAEASAGEHRLVAPRLEDQLPIVIPERWSAGVLLISGLSPALERAAGFCKAARAARRAGEVVMLDINARWHLWTGQDSRSIQSILVEADVVRCSSADLAALWMDTGFVRAAMRPDAILVVSDGGNPARALGPFGEVSVAPKVVSPVSPSGAGDAFTAAVCADLVRSGGAGADRPEQWLRALGSGHEAAAARARR